VTLDQTFDADGQRTSLAAEIDGTAEPADTFSCNDLDELTYGGDDRLSEISAVNKYEDDHCNQGLRCNGERGIRTPGTGVNPYNGLANRRLQPLGHLSGVRSGC
jgi:hypothetical protein